MAEIAYILTDARQRHAEYPGTFELPPDSLLDALTPGSIVKICAEFDPERVLSNVTPLARAQWTRKVGADRAGRMDGERFWTVITAVDRGGREPVYTGTIDNDLIYSANHGLRCGDTVRFARRHILQVHQD
jgi:hypothetical protein